MIRIENLKIFRDDLIKLEKILKRILTRKMGLITIIIASMENTGFEIVNGPSKVHVRTIHEASDFEVRVKLKHFRIFRGRSR